MQQDIFSTPSPRKKELYISFLSSDLELSRQFFSGFLSALIVLPFIFFISFYLPDPLLDVSGWRWSIRELWHDEIVWFTTLFICGIAFAMGAGLWLRANEMKEFFIRGIRIPAGFRGDGIIEFADPTTNKVRYAQEISGLYQPDTSQSKDEFSIIALPHRPDSFMFFDPVGGLKALHIWDSPPTNITKPLGGYKLWEKLIVVWYLSIFILPLIGFILWGNSSRIIELTPDNWETQLTIRVAVVGAIPLLLSLSAFAYAIKRRQLVGVLVFIALNLLPIYAAYASTKDIFHGPVVVQSKISEIIFTKSTIILDNGERLIFQNKELTFSDESALKTITYLPYTRRVLSID